MKLTMLESAGELKVVGVEMSEEQMQFVDLCAVDDSLPNCILGILIEGVLDRAGRAFQDGLAQKKFIEGKIKAPITKPEKIICIGLNYGDHARETKAEIPSEPVCFGKYANTIIGPGDSIRLPAVSQRVDYEAELVVVIGKSAYQVDAADALDYVAGYMIGNDVSARDWQKGRPGGQWMLGKTPDTFAPIGPYLVTSEEVGDPHQLSISLTLNGETMQQSSATELIFGIDKIIAHLTQIMTLQPGDLIFTGTPSGVGDARKPPVYLKNGDTVEVTIEKLGSLQNPVVS
ncbi:fumarylacetoacetate hydrolase family protein [Rubinisphaera sp.]|uniref:fumarylacetoacetate hydrolase family protein n=1 Tax=Rubinisphaera sp. TaxID=2024857 RepID=UPI000C10D105|nr:fumarylacetoacetate hydrolase family protein [Rubinisphaera sp.]MBV10506.1 fumarylacetoacetate hydrolase [Rubinisphaera sp.]HCS52364.1 fumarylacetoacetate hydrolase [Planctomycetaceae bacterium]|tara:strand:+ start:2924 stop:3787 length:864 start_codon:yes stop_codon:yes gene_type:complete